ncbi:kinase-like protein [Trametes coccinea BRFM310]|uniref:Kinase-like protein n=1 Tax=Trametes coccinea (strain BRFM310) TaxID=1353009 RepID=A0A1Y2IIL7_TRAC3|nr:kinase-like protein [Trametes coccinea BRFM310]
MSSPPQQRRLPTHAYLREDTVQRFTELTENGFYNLATKELFWQARYRYLLDHGYLLRPRYSPKWQPSWAGTKRNPAFCEDSIRLLDYQIMDATRLSDNELVAIKSFPNDTQELKIAQYFASIEDETNHCVPIREILPDPHDPEFALMVMPFLRPCNNPEFSTVGDVIEFVDQTLEGLVFMHRHRVAHRDIAVANLMMDAKALYPNGYHPVRLGYTPDTLYPVTALPRAGRKVRYFYIDFGLSARFPEGSSSYVLGDVGRHADVPELSKTVPYDAFKVDIYSLGNVYLQLFEKEFTNVEFLQSLIEMMRQQRPDQRPTADEALREWQKIRESLSESLFRWRLVPKAEPPIERVVNDTVALAWEGIHHLKKLVG